MAKTCNYYRARKQATKTENKGLFLVFFEIMTGLCCNSSSRRLMGVHIPGRYHGQSWRGFGPTDSWVRLLHCFVKWFMTFLGLKHVQLKPIIGCSHPLLRLMIIYNLCIYIYIYICHDYSRDDFLISHLKKHVFPTNLLHQSDRFPRCFSRQAKSLKGQGLLTTLGPSTSYVWV